MSLPLTFSVAALLLLGHALRQEQAPEPYRSVITVPVFGPVYKSGQGRYADFDVLTDSLNQMRGEGYVPTMLEVFVDYQRFDYGQNRFLIGGRAVDQGRGPVGEFRAVLTRPIIGPSWRAGQKGYGEFPAVTDALNQLVDEGYEPVHMELYADPVPGARRRNPPLNRLLIVARRL